MRGIILCFSLYLIMFNLGIGETSICVCAKTLVEVRNGDFVEVDVKLLLQLVQVFLLRLG